MSKVNVRMREVAIDAKFARFERCESSQNKMKETLIVAVCGHPELFNTSYEYRNRTT